MITNVTFSLLTWISNRNILHPYIQVFLQTSVIFHFNTHNFIQFYRLLEVHLIAFIALLSRQKKKVVKEMGDAHADYV